MKALLGAALHAYTSVVARVRGMRVLNETPPTVTTTTPTTTGDADASAAPTTTTATTATTDAVLDATAVVSQLYRLMLSLNARYIVGDGHAVDYAAVRDSDEFRSLAAEAHKLCRCDLHSLSSSAERMAFFISARRASARGGEGAARTRHSLTARGSCRHVQPAHHTRSGDGRSAAAVGS